MKKLKEKDMTVKELAGIMLKSFDSAQKHVNERFDVVGKQFGTLTEQMNKNFAEVKKQIHNISRNNVDVIHQEDFDKLEDRVVVLEEVTGLGRKKG